MSFLVTKEVKKQKNKIRLPVDGFGERHLEALEPVGRPVEALASFGAILGLADAASDRRR
jgi:hypothetical protein